MVSLMRDVNDHDSLATHTVTLSTHCNVQVLILYYLTYFINFVELM